MQYNTFKTLNVHFSLTYRVYTYKVYILVLLILPGDRSCMDCIPVFKSQRYPKDNYLTLCIRIYRKKSRRIRRRTIRRKTGGRHRSNCEELRGKMIEEEMPWCYARITTSQPHNLTTSQHLKTGHPVTKQTSTQHAHDLLSDSCKSTKHYSSCLFLPQCLVNVCLFLSGALVSVHTTRSDNLASSIMGEWHF